jgi:glycosyltransferase involved in cell wall biosynthesis
MRVLFFGTYDVEAHPRVLVLQEGLRAHGHRVSECNAPLRLDTAARVAMLHNPGRAWRLAARLARRWITLVVKRLRAGRVDAVVVGYLGQFDVLLARALFPRTTIVLDFLVAGQETALDRGAPAGSPKMLLLRAIDRAAMEAATTILLDTPERVAVVPPRLRGRVAVVRVGASRDWFVPSPPEHPADGLAVIFFGLFTPLQGTPVTGRAIALLADDPRISFTVVGTGQDSREVVPLTTANPRVRWIDWIPAAELPAAVAEQDVCLGIFGDTPKAAHVVPNKVFQGAAAGCAVVTSDTAAQRAVFRDCARYVRAADPAHLADVLRELADDRERLAAARKAAHALAVRDFQPQTVVEPLLRRLA